MTVLVLLLCHEMLVRRLPLILETAADAVPALNRHALGLLTEHPAAAVHVRVPLGVTCTVTIRLQQLTDLEQLH